MPTLSLLPKECHLLALPAELRLEIFAHVANEPSPLEQLIRAAQAGTFLYTENVVRMLYRAIDTGFMQSCRQIRVEALEVVVEAVEAGLNRMERGGEQLHEQGDLRQSLDLPTSERQGYLQLRYAELARNALPIWVGWAGECGRAIPLRDIYRVSTTLQDFRKRQGDGTTVVFF